MSNHMVGSSQPTIPMKTIRVLEVPLPSFETQERIVAIIHSLDEKVRLNQRINDDLERQAQAVFTDWFIEFTPFANEEFSVKDTRVLGPPQRAQKNSPAKPRVFQGTFKLWREANSP